jgi:hypothetical protein
MAVRLIAGSVELIDKNIGTTAQEFYAKWDALTNTSMESDTNTTQLVAVYSNLASAKLQVDLVISQIAQQNAQQLQTEYQSTVHDYVNNISSLQTDASGMLNWAIPTSTRLSSWGPATITVDAGQ